MNKSSQDKDCLQRVHHSVHQHVLTAYDLEPCLGLPLRWCVVGTDLAFKCYASLPRVQVQMLTVCAENARHSFLLPVAEFPLIYYNNKYEKPITGREGGRTSESEKGRGKAGDEELPFGWQREKGRHMLAGGC